MKLLKYFAGSLIISFGIMFVVSILVRAFQIELPDNAARYGLAAWILLAIMILPFAKKIIRA